VHEASVDRILGVLNEKDAVLDVGGWACPFNRANYILDAQPYETRGFYRTFGGPAAQGPEEESFGRETWIQRDICDRAPWPFADKQFDFAICSHTLEDLRDPLWVCAELIRVAKRGYIEVPSRAFESCRGLERAHQAGLSHHRWLIEIENGEIVFTQKYHMIHHWRYALPASYRRQLNRENEVQSLWWEGEFRFREVFHHGADAIAADLSRFVSATHPHHPIKLAVGRTWDVTCRVLKSVLRRFHGLLKTKDT
jgi:hypothetical protein